MDLLSRRMTGDFLSRRRWVAAASAALIGCGKRVPVVAHVTAIAPDSPAGRETSVALQSAVDGHELRLETIHLDSNGHLASYPQAAEQVRETVARLRPDVVLAFGDEVMTHLVIPFMRQGPTPIIFGGVQWSANAYEVPNRFITGMVEQPPVEDAIRMCLSGRSGAKEIFVLAGDTPEVRRNRIYLDPIYWRNKLSTTYGLVPDFVRWKRAFRWANEHADIVYFVSNGGIADWDHDEALQHVQQWSRTPVFTCDQNLMPYVVAGRVNDPREQGEWMGKQTLLVLEGTMPGEIRLAYTTRSTALHNSTLAEKIGFSVAGEGK